MGDIAGGETNIKMQSDLLVRYVLPQKGKLIAGFILLAVSFLLDIPAIRSALLQCLGGDWRASLKLLIGMRLYQIYVCYWVLTCLTKGTGAPRRRIDYYSLFIAKVGVVVFTVIWIGVYAYFAIGK